MKSSILSLAVRKCRRRYSAPEIMAYLAFVFFMVCAAIVIAIGHYYVRPADESFRLELEAQISDQAVSQEYIRLWIKHGYPTVIYEREQTPYFYNSRGEKCRFV